MSAGVAYSLKQKLGVLALDLPRLMPALLTRRGWVDAANRQDCLESSTGERGVRCQGRWSSDLHACHVYPGIGRHLMKRAFTEWPITLEGTGPVSDAPQVSFIIPHRGKDRLPLLHATIDSIAAQQGVAVECLVVEQSTTREVEGLPAWVKCIHLPHATDPRGWYKGWAYNVGVAAARSDVVVCHDGDILVPQGYAAEVFSKLDGAANQVAHLQRFLFCLNEQATEATLSSNRLCFDRSPERVRQNWQGGTLAIRKNAFWQIGGYDEEFIDWGGEDNEFFDRCLTLKGSRFGYLPFVHLWHEPQATKVNATRDDNLDLLRRKLSIPAQQRIDALINKKGQSN